jgi:hypothetical protein
MDRQSSRLAPPRDGSPIYDISDKYTAWQRPARPAFQANLGELLEELHVACLARYLESRARAAPAQGETS